MKRIRLEAENAGTVTFTQYKDGGKVKIEIKYGTLGGYDVVYVTPDKANEFYKKRLADGYQRVLTESR